MLCPGSYFTVIRYSTILFAFCPGSYFTVILYSAVCFPSALTAKIDTLFPLVPFFTVILPLLSTVAAEVS